MNWGSAWEFTDYTRQNWWNLWLDDDADNAGGSSFAASQTKEKGQPNAFLRVAPRQDQSSESSTGSTSANSLPDDTKRDYIYATESFDRQQQDRGVETDSRWLADRQGLQVPVLDDRLVVAFQKVLRDEELEFLLLVLAEEESGVDGYYN